MRSRWTDFLTTDGEKTNRNRDSEFVDAPATRSDLLAAWEDGWNCVFNAIEPLTGRGPRPRRYDSGRGAFGDAGHQSATGALFATRRSNRDAG